MTTILDVARECGVSKTTVSYVVNNGPRPVHAKTRQRVLEAINRLDYRPNAIARSLNRRSTGVLGIYLCNGNDNIIKMRDPYFAEVFSGIEMGCKEHGKDWLVHTVSRGSTIEEIYDKLANGQIDGLILIDSPSEHLSERLANSPLPIVTLTDPMPSIPSVRVDDAAGVRLIAEHLAGKGHRRVLFRLVRDVTSSIRRYNAFRTAAESLGMLVVEFGEDGFDAYLTEQDLVYLSTPSVDRPTAVVCWNDYWAHNVMSACKEIGLRVPEDIAVTGFDGFEPVGAPPAYHLTTINAPWAEAARVAIKLLIARIAGDEVPKETVLPVRLKVGDTT